MEYVTLGNSGCRVSRLGISLNTGTDTLNAALSAGINYFDLGNDLARIDSSVSTSLSRAATKDGPFLTATVSAHQLSSFDITRYVDAILKQFGQDHLALLNLESPPSLEILESVLRGVDNLIRQGKLLYIGCSNYPTWVMVRGLWLSDVNNLARFEAASLPYNIFCQDVSLEFMPFAKREGLSVISPIANSTRLTIEPLASDSDDSVQAVYATLLRELNEVANEASTSAEELALDWALRSGTDICVINTQDAQFLTRMNNVVAKGFDSAVKARVDSIAESWRERAPVLYPFETTSKERS